MEGYTRTEGNIPYGDRAVLTVFNLMARYDYGEVGADALPERYLALDQFHMTCRLHVDGLLTGDDELPCSPRSSRSPESFSGSPLSRIRIPTSTSRIRANAGW